MSYFFLVFSYYFEIFYVSVRKRYKKMNIQITVSPDVYRGASACILC